LFTVFLKGIAGRCPSENERGDFSTFSALMRIIDEEEKAKFEAEKEKR
jgi:hypothetical protein